MADGNEEGGPQERRLRPEARPVLFADLDQAQQAAFRRILQLITNAVDSIPDARVHAADDSDWLRHDRSSRIAFLSGSRGTGKTTVLLSLAQELERWRKGESSRQAQTGHQATQKLIQDLAGRLVWLEHCDMEAVPDTVNLLAGILARIESATRFGAGGSADISARRLGGVLDPAPDYHKALIELQQLQADVALSWDGNLGSRGAHLDPDVYALEVMRTERARLKLNPRLAGVLDALAKQPYYGQQVSNPVFLLPIDDFDINPGMCLPLLRLIRMISVPRLFVLVLGDIEIAKVVLNLQMSGQLAGMTGQAGRAGDAGEMLSVPIQEVSNVAAEIAFNALRKLVPPAQRVNLKPLQPLEALKFRPLDHRNDLTFGELLAAVPVENVYLRRTSGERLAMFDEDVDTLERFLLIPRFAVPVGEPDSQTRHAHAMANGRSGPDAAESSSIDGLNLKQRLDRAAYQARSVLNAPVRRLTDLWFELSDVVTSAEVHVDEAAPDEEKRASRRQRFRSAVEFFGWVCQNALEEDRATDRLARRDLPSALGTTAVGEPDFALLKIRSQSVPRSQQRVTMLDKADIAADAEIWPQLVVTGHKSWIFSVGDGHDSKNSDLSPQSASAFMLYHDLLILGGDYLHYGGGRFSPIPMKDNHQDHNWAVVEWHEGTASWPVSIRWPLPAWHSYWELDLFLHAWNDLTDRLEATPVRQAQKHLVSWLAFGWMAASAAVLSGEKPPATKRQRPWRDGAPDDNDWSELRTRLEALAVENSTATLRGQRLRDWAVHLALMALPESGLPPDARDQLARSNRLAGLWMQERVMIQDLHKVELEKFNNRPETKLWLEQPDQLPKPVRRIFDRVSKSEQRP